MRLKATRTTAQEMRELERERIKRTERERAAAMRIAPEEEITGYLSVHPMVAVGLNALTDPEFIHLMYRVRELMKQREINAVWRKR